MKKLLYSFLIFFALASTAYGAARTIRWIPETNDLLLIAPGETGNVGIATSTPARPFSVEGDTLLTGQLKVGGLYATSSVRFGTISGSTQCLQVDSTGLLSGTGAVCGSGGGGGGSGDIGIFTINSQKYLAASTSNYAWLTRNSGLISHGSSTFASLLNIGGAVNASSTLHVDGASRFVGTLVGRGDILDASGRNVSNGAIVTVASTTAAGDVTTIAAAIALLPSGGGSIEVGCGNFSLAANGGAIDRSFINITGQGDCTNFQYNQATQGVGFFNSDPTVQRTSVRLKNFRMSQTGTAGNATCIDFSGFVYSDIENVNCTGSKIGMIASTTNTFYNTISKSWANVSGASSTAFWVSNSANDNTFENVKAITSSASEGFYIDAHSTHCFACTVEADAVIGVHILDEGDDTLLSGVYLEGNKRNLYIELGAENINVTGFIADADDTSNWNIVDNGACGLTVNARVQYSTTKGNYTTSAGCTGENALFQGFGTSTPWGLLSVDQDTNHSNLEPSFVVADNGTSTPFLSVNSKGGVSIGTLDTSIAYGNLAVSGNLTVGSCTGCTAGTSTSIGTTGKLFSSFTGTSTMLGSLTLGNATNKNILSIIPTGSVGTGNAAVGEGALTVSNTLNTQSPGLYVSSDQAGVPSNPLTIIRSSSASYNQGLLWLLGSSSNTGGAAYGLKIADGNPDIEFDESDQTSPAGDYEIDVNNDLWRANGRDAGNSSFDTIFTLQRRDYGAAGQGGRACLGCVFSTPTGGLLDIVASSTPGEDYLTLSTSVGGGQILTVDRNGNLKLGVGAFNASSTAHITGNATFGAVTNYIGTINASSTAHITGNLTTGNASTTNLGLTGKLYSTFTGTSTLSGGLNIVGVTNAFNLGFDTSNFATFHTNSAGDLRINTTGDDVFIADKVRINSNSGSALDVDGGLQTLLVNTTNGWIGVGATTTFSVPLAVDGEAVINGRLRVAGLQATSSVFFTGLTNAGGDVDAVCIIAATGEITDNAADTCLVSSIRFKENVKPLGSSLSKVLKLNPVSFEFKDDLKNKVHLGLIAEEVLKVEPRLVGFEKDGVTPRSVSYEETTALLIKAIQELNAKVDAQAKEIKMLKAKLK